LVNNWNRKSNENAINNLFEDEKPWAKKAVTISQLAYQNVEIIKKHGFEIIENKGNRVI